MRATSACDDAGEQWRACRQYGQRDHPEHAPQWLTVLVPCRTAHRDDLEAVLGLAEAFYLEDDFNITSSRLRTHLIVLLASDDAHVAVVDGVDPELATAEAPVAFAVTTTSFGLEAGLIAELEDLYVRPDDRGRGFGGELVAESIRWAGQRGCSQLEIVVVDGPHQQRLLGYYRGLGFAEARTLLRRPVD